MPTSLKQWKANRENAKKSTGPRTAEGKAVSSLNATRHGLYAANTIVSSPHLKEDESEYKALLAGLIVELDPQGVLQYQLVSKIATCLWRQRRLINAETASINQDLDTDSLFSEFIYGKVTDEQVAKSPHLMDRVHASSIPSGRFAETLMRQEYRLDRQLMNAYKLLHTLQKNAAAESQKDTAPAQSSRPRNAAIVPSTSPGTRPARTTDPINPTRLPGETDDQYAAFQKWRNEPNSETRYPTACGGLDQSVPSDTKITHNEPISPHTINAIDCSDCL